MKTTVIYTGHLRTFAQCFPSQYWQVLRHLPEPRFVVSCVLGDDEPEAARCIIAARFPDAQIDVEAVEQPAIPEPGDTPKAHAPYAISVPVQSVLRQLWALRRGMQFSLEAGGLSEIVVRIRPDLHFQSGITRRDVVLKADLLGKHREVIAHMEDPAMQRNECLTPWWGCFGGINDRFAIMGPEAAESYFGTFSAIDTLLRMGCPLHPESLVAGALELTQTTISRTLPTMFSTLRPDGSARPPEILAHEIAEYARA